MRPIRHPTAPLLFGLSLLAVAGCAQHPAARAPRGGDVSYARVVPAHAERFTLAPEQVYQLGAMRPESRVVPSYPPALLERRLPAVSACVELFVDEHGEVYEAHALVQGVECPVLAADLAAAFHPAAVAAVRQWAFDPSFVCERRPGWIADDCEGEGRERQAVPVTLAYRFQFRQVAGKPVVDIAPAH